MAPSKHLAVSSGFLGDPPQPLHPPVLSQIPRSPAPPSSAPPLEYAADVDSPWAGGFWGSLSCWLLRSCSSACLCSCSSSCSWAWKKVGVRAQPAPWLPPPHCTQAPPYARWVRMPLPAALSNPATWPGTRCRLQPPPVPSPCCRVRDGTSSHMAAHTPHQGYCRRLLGDKVSWSGSTVPQRGKGSAAPTLGNVG